MQRPIGRHGQAVATDARPGHPDTGSATVTRRQHDAGRAGRPGDDGLLIHSFTASRAVLHRGPGPLLWPLLAGWTALWTWLRWSPSGISWHFFPLAARLLFTTTGLHLYAHHPELQFGPLTVVAVAPLTALPATTGLAVAQLLMSAGGLLALWLVADVAGDAGPGRSGLLLAGIVLMPSWTVLSVRWAHADDVLALVLLAAAIRAVLKGRALWVGVLLAAAIGAKPWAVGCVPIMLALPRRDAVRAATAAGVVAVMLWAPFFVADAGTWAALRPPVAVVDSSPLRLFGVRSGVVPAWTRSVQLVGAPLAGLLTVLRGRWPAALLAAIAVRLVLDPQDIGYYSAGAVLAAAVVDLAVPARRVPWTALVTTVALWQPFVADYARRLQDTHAAALWWFEHPTAVAAAHVGWAAWVLGTLLLGRRSWPTSAAGMHALPGR